MKNPAKLEKAVMKFANELHDKGYSLEDIKMAMFHRGAILHHGAIGESVGIIVSLNNHNGVALEWPEDGYKAAIVPENAFATTLVGDDDVTAPYLPMSRSRISEFLDYASCYGEFDENTANGTESMHPNSCSAMNDYRRAAIVLLKKVLGFLPDDYVVSMPDYSDADVPALIRAAQEAHTQFCYYAEQHDAKGTPESAAKAQVNRDFASIMAAALGKRANFGPRAAVQRDSGDLAPSGAPTLRKVSSAPLDRDEVLGWIDMKIAGSNAAGMHETVGVLEALRGELAQHLEAAPTDIYRALTEIIVGIGSYNVAKGWWSDANTDLRTCDYAPYVMASKMYLVVTEMAEAMEGHRKSSKTKTLPDDHLPEFPMVAVEFADALIRLFDLGANYRLPNGQTIDVPAAVVAKLAYNDRREDHKVENRAKDGGKTI